MTEKEWLGSKIPRWMFKDLGQHPPDRKVRLLAVACCRRLGYLLSPACAAAVEINEQFADGMANLDALTRAARSAWAAYSRADRKARGDKSQANRSHAAWAVWAALRQLPDPCEIDATGARPVEWAAASVRMAGVALNPATGPSQPAGLQGGTKEERTIQASILRDIFGNPFRSVTFDPEWRTSTAESLAKQMYDSRAFSVMPILADALQDAGCDNDKVLNHCRDATGVHVRGCWVVDLVLGKT